VRGKIRDVDSLGDVEVSVPDVVVSPGLMSLVTGGLVLVIVGVVVVDAPVRENELELLPPGSRKYWGVGAGSLNSRASVEMMKYSSASTTSAAALAPTSVDVRSCHAGASPPRSS
jgi:hypothetical protein